MPSLSLGVTATISRLVRLLLLFAEEAVRGGEPAVDLGVFAFELVGLIPEDKEIVNRFLELLLFFVSLSFFSFSFSLLSFSFSLSAW